MDAQATEALLRFFRSIQDPRAANAWHRLSDVLTIAILAGFLLSSHGIPRLCICWDCWPISEADRRQGPG